MSDQSFESVFDRASRFRRMSPNLRPLLERVYAAIHARPAVRTEIRSSLEELFVFLSSPDGRTDANCAVTDYFFSFAEESQDQRAHLPVDVQHLLAGIGGALHDTIYAPDIAENFGCLPEQLLEKTRKMKDGD